MPNDLTPPKRGYSFRDHALSKPGQPLPGDRLDTELDRIVGYLTQIQQFLAQSFDADGSLKGSSVSERNLKPNILTPLVARAQQAVDEALEVLTAREKSTQSLVTQAQNHLKTVETLVQQALDAQSKAQQAETRAKAAQKDALTSRARAEKTFQALQPLQLDAQTAANSARIAEDMAYRWAEKTDGPVFVPLGGDPVDDGFYSAKFYALRTGALGDEVEQWWQDVRDWHQEIETVFYPELNAIYDDWRSRYYGPSPTPPTQDPLGNPPTDGDLYFNTVAGAMFVWDGNVPGWVGFQGTTITEFTGLTDTPNSYTGQAGKIPVVNQTQDGLAFQSTLRLVGTQDQTDVLDIHVRDGFRGITFSGDPVDRPHGYVGTNGLGDPIIQKLTSAGAFAAAFQLQETDALIVNLAATPPNANSLITRARGDARYLALAGGTMTGFLTLNAAPTADLHAATKAYVDTGVNGRLTQAQADARYLRLAGGTMTGPLVLNTGALVQQILQARSSDQIQEISFRRNDGAVTDRFDIRVQHTTGNPLLTFRPNGVTTASFLASGFASFTGAVQANGVVSLGDVQLRTDLNPSFSMRSAAGAVNGLVYLNRAGASPTFAGRISFNAYAPDGTLARVVGQLEDRIQDGGSLASAQSIITREHGDARYGQRFESVGNSQTVFQGDLDTLFGPNASSVYFCNTAATNAPENVSGHLFVETHPTNGNFAAQRFVENGGASRVWVRTRASGVWGAWQLSGGLTEAAADLRYLQLTGGRLENVNDNTFLTIKSGLTPDGFSILRFERSNGQRAMDVGWREDNDSAFISVQDPAGTTVQTWRFPQDGGAADSLGVLRRTDADARYAQLNTTPVFGWGVSAISDGTAWPQFIARANQQPANQRQARFRISASDGTVAIDCQNDNDSVQQTYRFERTATLAANQSVVRRDTGDARYQLASSDATFKERITDLDAAMPLLAALQPRNFFWKEQAQPINADDGWEPDPSRPAGVEQVGLIAQEVQKVLPTAVLGEEGSMTVQTLPLVSLLIKAVQELAARVEELETR